MPPFKGKKGKKASGKRGPGRPAKYADAFERKLANNAYQRSLYHRKKQRDPESDQSEPHRVVTRSQIKRQEIPAAEVNEDPSF